MAAMRLICPVHPGSHVRGHQTRVKSTAVLAFLERIGLYWAVKVECVDFPARFQKDSTFLPISRSFLALLTEWAPSVASCSCHDTTAGMTPGHAVAGRLETACPFAGSAVLRTRWTTVAAPRERGAGGPGRRKGGTRRTSARWTPGTLGPPDPGPPDPGPPDPGPRSPDPRTPDPGPPESGVNAGTELTGGIGRIPW